MSAPFHVVLARLRFLFFGCFFALQLRNFLIFVNNTLNYCFMRTRAMFFMLFALMVSVTVCCGVMFGKIFFVSIPRSRVCRHGAVVYAAKLGVAPRAQ